MTETSTMETIAIYEPIYAEDQTISEDQFLPYHHTTNQKYKDWREFRLHVELYRKQIHRNHEKCGIFSPKFHLKTRLRGSEFMEFAKSSTDAEVVFVNPFPQMPYISYNIWMQAEANHPGITTCARNLLAAANIPLDINTQRRHSRQVLSYSSFWLGTPRFWDIYVGQVLDPLARFIEENPDHPSVKSSLQETFHTDPTPFLPFITERLFTTFLADNPKIKHRSLELNPLDFCLSNSEALYLQSIKSQIDEADACNIFPAELIVRMQDHCEAAALAAKDYYTKNPHPHTGRTISSTGKLVSATEPPAITPNTDEHQYSPTAKHFAGGKFCVFSHYNHRNSISRYVLHYLQSLKNAGYKIVFVSTSKVEAGDLEQLKPLCHKTHFRPNTGYDFSSYREGISLVLEEEKPIDCILIANDSVFGPFSDLSKTLEQIEQHPAEIVGLTDSYDIGYHLQSYFIHYKKAACSSESFKEFWSRVQPIDNDNPNFKQKIVKQYEVGGTKYFLTNGFKVAALFPFRELLTHKFETISEKLKDIATTHPDDTIREVDLRFHLNATHYYWNDLILAGLPFIKRELLARNPTNTDISNWPDEVVKFKNFDPTLIFDALVELNSTLALYPIPIAQAIRQLPALDDKVSARIHPLFESIGKQLDLPPVITLSFDEQEYLRLYPDIRESVTLGLFENGLSHFHLHGVHENRLFPLKNVT